MTLFEEEKTLLIWIHHGQYSTRLFYTTDMLIKRGLVTATQSQDYLTTFENLALTEAGEVEVAKLLLKGMV